MKSPAYRYEAAADRGPQRWRMQIEPACRTSWRPPLNRLIFLSNLCLSAILQRLPGRVFPAAQTVSADHAAACFRSQRF
ncbi:MAG TPA: hypothetical protein DCF61_01975 [Alphaproteobacteria bacterium]|nr:hypothetical protein [Alphaproteobacteria bacterium]HCO92067.1 hypothetical protein [Alphaproteobacteria bacterium]